MRQGQQNRRGRGRNNNNSNNNNNSSNNPNNNRKPQNPLSRNYESSGPDVKIRGTAAQIAEKYITLARDASSSSDTVMAENYLQHAEHYNRIIMAAQAQAQAAAMSHHSGDGAHGMNGSHRNGAGEMNGAMREQPQPHPQSAPQPQMHSAPQPQAQPQPVESNAFDEMPQFLQTPVPIRDGKSEATKEAAAKQPKESKEAKEPKEEAPAEDGRRRRRRYTATANGTGRAAATADAGNGNAIEVQGDDRSNDEALL